MIKYTSLRGGQGGSGEEGGGGRQRGKGGRTHLLLALVI